MNEVEVGLENPTSNGGVEHISVSWISLLKTTMLSWQVERVLGAIFISGNILDEIVISAEQSGMTGSRLMGDDAIFVEDV